MKKCTKCGEEKAETDFYRMYEGRRPSCKECDKVYQNTWQKRNPDKAREYNSKWNRDNWEEICKRRRFNRYGVRELGPECEICGSKEALCADHNHATNKFRGTLCRACNTAAGLVKEDTKVLNNMIEYLERNVS